jgi:putative Mg2+ transporter-C (MgtC) family protein
MDNPGLLDSLVAFFAGMHCVMLGDLMLALFLGLMVGYERYYRGRAAGMRTYGFVCMASCALTAMLGYQRLWFGGSEVFNDVDPTRVIQGVVTGIGFLGAGVIMRDGMSISGLTTAASIWALAAVGILVGVGFYDAAILISVVLFAFMMWLSKFEHMLPARHALFVTLHFKKSFVPREQVVRAIFDGQGYDIAANSFSVGTRGESHEWRFVAVARGRKAAAPLTELSDAIANSEGIESCNISHARN